MSDNVRQERDVGAADMATSATCRSERDGAARAVVPHDNVTLSAMLICADSARRVCLLFGTAWQRSVAPRRPVLVALKASFLFMPPVLSSFYRRLFSVFGAMHD